MNRFEFESLYHKQVNDRLKTYPYKNIYPNMGFLDRKSWKEIILNFENYASHLISSNYNSPPLTFTYNGTVFYQVLSTTELFRLSWEIEE